MGLLMDGCLCNGRGVILKDLWNIFFWLIVTDNNVYALHYFLFVFLFFAVLLVTRCKRDLWIHCCFFVCPSVRPSALLVPKKPLVLKLCMMLGTNRVKKRYSWVRNTRENKRGSWNFWSKQIIGEVGINGELGKIGSFNKMGAWNNRGAQKNTVNLTFSDEICLLCAISRFTWHHHKQNEDLLICGKRTRRFKRHWTFETQSDPVSMGTWSNRVFREETTHTHRNQTRLHSSCDLWLRFARPHALVPKYGPSSCQPKILFLVAPCLFVECGCPVVRVKFVLLLSV